MRSRLPLSTARRPIQRLELLSQHPLSMREVAHTNGKFVEADDAPLMS